MEAILNWKPAAPSRANPGLPAALDSISAKSLEKDREGRYQRAADLWSDLKRVKGEQQFQSPVASTSPDARAKTRIARRWRVA